MSSLLFILHNYFNRAGTEQHTKDLTEALTDWEVWTAFRDRGKLCLRRPSGDIEVFPSEAPVWPVTPYRQPATEDSLRKIIAAAAPDLIHIQHFIHWPLSVIDIATNADKPVVLSLHDYYALTPAFTMQGVSDARRCTDPEYAKRVFSADISEYLRERQRVLAKSFERLSAVVAPSQFVREEITKVYPLSVRVIEHGIKRFDPLPRRHAFLQDKELVFGYIGSLLPQKGWEVLLRAFAVLHRELPATKLNICGGVSDVPAELAEGVEFSGVYEQHELPVLLSDVDVGIIPSVFPETFSLTLSELWQGNVPTAASAIGAFPERIKDGTNGKLFPPGDIQALTSVLRWFVEHKEWREWPIPTVRGIEAMASDYSALYHQLISRGA